MQEFFSNILAGVGIMDIIDIAIVAYLIYRILMFIRSTRAEQLLKGLLVLVVVMIVSGLLNLHTLNWILRGIMTLGAVALVVVFQQELRRGLEYLGRTKFLKGSGMDKDKAKHITHEFIRAIETFSKDRTGALIVLERDTALSEMTESGTIINAEISAELLGMYQNKPCTAIDVNFLQNKIKIQNYTKDILHRAFGVKESPTWEDFHIFLQDRCFPKTRGNVRTVLAGLGLQDYDPLQIVEKTKGRTAEDDLWLKFQYYERAGTGA